MKILDETLTIESLKHHLDFMNEMKSHEMKLAPLWIKTFYPEILKHYRPTIGSISFDEKYLYISFSVYIGCGEDEHHQCDIPLEIAISDDFEHLMMEYKKLLDHEALLEAHEEAIDEDTYWTEQQAERARLRLQQYERLRAEFEGADVKSTGDKS
jgi:hypothetical protein